MARFEDASYVSGFALNEDGREMASMGIALGDYENNGLIDFFDTTFSDDYKVLYHNDGDANFTDVSYKAGDGRDYDSVSGLGRCVYRLRQRWLEGSLDVERSRVSGRWTSTTGARRLRERPLLFRNLDGKSFELQPAVKVRGWR